MGNNNFRKNNNNNKRRQSGYFTQNIQQNGEDFIYRKTTPDLRRDAQKVFKDLAYGNIDFEKHSKYFQESSFVQVLIGEANENFAYHNASYYGLQTFLNMYADATTDNKYYNVLNTHCKAANAYFILHKHLSNIMNDIIYKNYSNIEPTLKVLVNELRPVKSGLTSFSVLSSY